jgi:hypothetical protein
MTDEWEPPADSEKESYKEKLRSLQLNTGRNKGTTHTTVVPDERMDRVAGYQHEHWDGRVSATVTPLPVKVKASFKTEEG